MGTPERKDIRTRPCVVYLDPITPKPNPNFSTELKRAINERNMLTAKTRKRVTEALEEIESETLEEKNKTKKQQLLTEILESEEHYVGQLEVIRKFFLNPAKEQQLLKPQCFETLFGNINTIHSINRELLEELRKDPDNVAEAFSKIAPFFKSYSLYALGFKNILQILQECPRNNPKFAKFLEPQETRPEVQSKLSALLIAPIQRLPKYKLLLRALLKITSQFDRDYNCLQDSVRKVEEAAGHINKVIEDQENMQRLLELQRCIQRGEPNIITPGRYLVKEGVLFEVMPKPQFSRKYYVVLMNDIILICKVKNREVKVNSLKCQQIFPLNKCKITEIVDKGSFRIICEDQEIVLYHKTLTDGLEWIREIKNAISKCLNDRKTLRKDSSTRRPVKRKDVNEYNEMGISPGKKLRKKRNSYEEPANSSLPTLSRRKALRPDCQYISSLSSLYRTENQTLGFNTLRPTQAESPTSINGNQTSTDLFVFGQSHPDRGFSFKMGQWLCGLGNSVKNFFSLR